MNAFPVILRHEIRAALADRAVRAALAIFLLLAGYAFASGGAWADAREHEGRTATQQSEVRNGDLQRDLQRYEQGLLPVKPQASWYREWIKAPTTPDARASLPLAPLAALTPNAGDLQPLVASMRLATSRYALFDDYSASTQNPVSLAVGRLDMAFVLIVVLPILLIAVTYDALSGERECGTLALVLTQPVRLGEYLRAKFVARGLVVLGPVLAATALGAIVTSRAPGDAATWLATALLAAATLAYGMFWLSLSATVSALRRSSATNALTLGGLWLLLVLALPAVLNVIATDIHPPPERADLTNAMRATLVDAQRRGEDLFTDFNLAHPERPVPTTGAPTESFETPRSTLTIWLVRQKADAALAPLVATFERRLADQHRLAEQIRFASPAMAFQAALNRLSGADRARTEAFKLAARDHLDAMAAFLVPKLERGQKLASADYDRLPQFRMVSPPILGTVAADILGILAPTALALFAGALALRRYTIGG